MSSDKFSVVAYPNYKLSKLVRFTLVYFLLL